jgi:hypothetical protein
MTALDDFDSAVDRHRGALADIIPGSADGFKALPSREDDATVANPLGPPVRERGRCPPSVSTGSGKA